MTVSSIKKQNLRLRQPRKGLHLENSSRRNRLKRNSLCKMEFRIIWDEKAVAELDKLETIISRRIVKKVGELSPNPYTKDVRRLKGGTGFRLRVGDYRIIFL